MEILLLLSIERFLMTYILLLKFAFNVINVVNPWFLINYLGNVLYYEFNIKKVEKKKVKKEE